MCYSIISHDATLILCYHASMLTQQNSLIPRALLVATSMILGSWLVEWWNKFSKKLKRDDILHVTWGKACTCIGACMEASRHLNIHRRLACRPSCRHSLSPHLEHTHSPHLHRCRPHSTPIRPPESTITDDRSSHISRPAWSTSNLDLREFDWLSCLQHFNLSLSTLFAHHTLLPEGSKFAACEVD